MKRAVAVLGLFLIVLILSGCGDMTTGLNYLATGDTSMPSSGLSSFSLSFPSFGSGPSNTQSSSQPPPSTGDSVVGGPSLSADFINQVLSTAGSPAVGTGDTFYSMSSKYNIDDAWALAFFKHESTYGHYGVANSSLSIGNIRCVYKGYEDLGPWCQDNFTHWPSWQAGIEAWYRLIRNVYVNSWGYSTIESIIPHYAPNADHNNEAVYISSVEGSVAGWRQS